MELIKKRLGHYRETYFVTEENEEIIEIIVPDTNPDFENTISSFSVCTITDKSLLSGSVKITGQINSIINYSSSASECAYTINSSSPFSKSIKIEGCNPDDTLICDVKVCSSVVEIMNSRKIRITVRMNIACSVNHLDNINLIEDVCGEVGEGVCTLIESCGVNPCVDISEKSINFTDEIRLTEEESLNYFRFIRWDDCWKVDDIKIMQNRIMVRGHVQINAYSTTDSSLDIISKSYILPFSHVIECKNSYEDDSITSKICSNSLNIKLLQKDDVFYLNCECHASIYVKTYRKIEVKYLSDIYSTKYEVLSKKELFSFNSNTDVVEKESMVEEKIDIPDVAVKILDCTITPLPHIAEGQLCYKFIVSLIYCDADDQYKFYTSSLTSIISANKNKTNGNIICLIKDIDTSIDPTGIVVSFKPQTYDSKEEYLETYAITDCSIDKNSTKNGVMCGNLILRKVLEGETIWSIAKQYCTSPDAIIAANELQEIESLADEKLIIIPFLKH